MFEYNMYVLFNVLIILLLFLGTYSTSYDSFFENIDIWYSTRGFAVFCFLWHNTGKEKNDFYSFSEEKDLKRILYNTVILIGIESSNGSFTFLNKSGSSYIFSLSTAHVHFEKFNKYLWYNI
jgi:hypothetical protein